MKRFLDLVVAILGLIAVSPILIFSMFLIWQHDKHSPLYVSIRIGRNKKPFKMVKLRSMVVDADKSGVDTTTASDNRITPLGQFIRRFKLDELTQLWNVAAGHMSLVGPRPNVKRETDLYTTEEDLLLTIRPGITDIASIVFSDLGESLNDKPDPNLAYNQLVRPWKSRLGLVYVRNQTLILDVQLVFLTALAMASRKRALEGVQGILKRLKVDPTLLRVAARNSPLEAAPPPGAKEIVTTR